MVKRVLIIATAAKSGGAETIFKCAFDYMKNVNTVKFYIFGGVKGVTSTSHIKYFYCPTNGLMSFLFVIVISPILAWILRCSKVISFSNIAPYPIGFKVVAYFHQYLLLTRNSAMRRNVNVLYTWCIKHLMKPSEIIVQNSIVKKLFLEKFGHDYVVQIKWPGISHVRNIPESHSNKNTGKIVVLFPVSSLSLNKNVELFNKICKKNPTLEFVSFLPKQLSTANHIAMGRNEFKVVIEMIQKSNAMLFTSLEETLGLPIFEFALTGKPVYVLDRPYTKWIPQKFPFLENVIFFKDENVSIVTNPRICFSGGQINELVNGEWEFLY
jgi:hypothetical protein